MTGGVVIVLSTNVGRNVGAGMTGGIGYFYDTTDDFLGKINGEIVSVQRIQTDAGRNQLRSLIQEHFDRTGSTKAKAILENFDAEAANFWQVVPPSEANTPEASDLNAAEMAVAAA